MATKGRATKKNWFFAASLSILKKYITDTFSSKVLEPIFYLNIIEVSPEVAGVDDTRVVGLRNKKIMQYIDIHLVVQLYSTKYKG